MAQTPPLGQLIEAVRAAGGMAQRWGAAPPLAFAATMVRDAPNRQEVPCSVRAEAGVRLRTLPGEPEAELTFHLRIATPVR